MPLSTAELEELLSLALAALRANAATGAAVPAALAQVVTAAPAADQVAAQHTLNDWLDVHYGILAGRGYKPQTMKNRRSNMAHVRRLWGAQQITAIKPQQVAAHLKALSTSNAGRVLGELRDAFSEAIAAGWVETSPADHIKAPRHKVIRERLVFDVWQQMRTMAQTCRQRWVESMLLLALSIGQRRADLAKARFADVVDGHLRVEQQKEAGKGYGARVEIPLTLRMDCIGMTLGDVIEHCRQSARPGATLLRQANGRPIEMSSLSARFCACIRAVLGSADPGKYKRPSLHETRSLSARCYIEQGMPKGVVQTLLGHSNLEMTLLYLHERGAAAQRWRRVEPAAAC